MAISWGSTVGNFRLGVERSGRTWRVYGQSVRYGHNWNYTLSFSGSTGGSISGRFTSAHNETKTVLLHSWTMPAKTSYNFTARLTSVLVGGATVTGRYTYTPPSKPNAPGKPGKPSVSRSSDAQHTVSWSGSGTWTGANLQRQEDNESAKSVASPGGNPRSWVDKSTRGNKRYRWRVRGKNAGGWGPFSDWSNWVYTTPGKPGKPTARKRSNGDITVDASMPAYATHFNLDDDGTAIGGNLSVGLLPYNHASPSAAVPHRYRVRGRRDSGTSNNTTLVGAWSDYSETVQLAAPPAAPTDLDPNGVARDSGAEVVFAWVHNPVDSSDQTAFELQYREIGGAWVPVSGTTAETVAVLLDGGDYEWRVRTKGVHASWSPYSAIATVSVLDQPGVAVLQPDGAEPVDYSTLNVEWSFFQAQDAPQSEWEVELYDADNDLLESKSGADGATSTVLATRLTDETDYVVRVRAASGGLWSEWDEMPFTVEFIPPIPGTLDGAWNDETGAVDLVAGFAEQPVPAEHRNWMPRIQGTGEPVEIRRNLSRNPAFVDKTMMLSQDGPITTGGGAQFDLDTSWSYAGGSSARLSGGSTGATSLYVIGRTGLGEGEPVGSLAGQMVTVGATVRLAAPQISPREGGDPRSIAVGVNDPGSPEINWEYARSEQPPNSPGEYRLSVSFNLPSNPDAVWFIRLFNGDESNKTDIWWDAVTIELGETDGSYFDGFYEELGVVAHWEDEPYLSESYLEVEPVEGFTGVDCTPVLAEWEGRPAVKILPSDTPGHAWFTIPAEARGGGTFMGTIGLEEATDGESVTPFVESPKQEPALLTGEAGSEEVRLFYDALTSNYRAVLPVGDKPVVWSRLGLYEPDYEGVQWDGDTSWVEINGERLFTKWDPDGGSVTGAPGNPVLLTIERNMGDEWVLMYETEELGESFLPDYEALSNGINEYRVTTWSELGATSQELFYIASDSGAVWLSGGPDFETVCRLPYDPQPSREAGRATTTRMYAGRSKPVIYKGTHVSRTIDIAGTVLTDEDDNATYEALETLAQTAEPVHLYRDPDGERVYGALNSVSVSRQSHAHWSYSTSLTESDRG